MFKKILSAALLTAVALPVSAAEFELIEMGDFENWITRHITESSMIGGQKKTVYAIGPTQVIDENKPLENDESPWATSNVYAKVSKIEKASNTVEPVDFKGSKAAKLTTKLEQVKVLKLINMDVMVPGTIYLGKVKEPISSTKNPYGKMEMGMPYTKRPKALQYDFQVDMPNVNTRMKATGLGAKKTIPGRDQAEVYVLLQKRWEDEDGNIHALRVGTGRERYNKSVAWSPKHQLPIRYGDITGESGYEEYMGLLNGEKAYSAYNSRGKLVPVQEEGWADADETPTHVLVMASTTCGEAFVGTEGITMYIDNIGFAF